MSQIGERETSLGFRSDGVDVPEVVDRVVDHVLGERGDGERRTVTAPAAALPLVAVDGTERVGERDACLVQLDRHDRGVLFVVALRQRGLVLVPVGEQRVVHVDHQGEAGPVQPQDVPHVRCVLERGPPGGIRARPQVLDGRVEHGDPAVGRLADERGHGGRRDRAGGEPALGAGSLEHPCPVLVVGNDRIGHRRSLPSAPFGSRTDSRCGLRSTK